MSATAPPTTAPDRTAGVTPGRSPASLPASTTGAPRPANLPATPRRSQAHLVRRNPAQAAQLQRAEKLARSLGWFSIGLGVAELLAPRLVNRLGGGAGERTALVRLYGLREIAAGLLIFAGGRRPVAGLWARVAGDVLDLATLAGALALPGTDRRLASISTAAVAGITALDLEAARAMSRETGAMTDDGEICLRRSVTTRVNPDEVYQFWRRLENLPRFMAHLQSVEQLDERRSHWVTRGPAGTTIEWDAEITEDRPNELLAWRSTQGTAVSHSGWVQFEPRPGARGTIVRVELRYKPLGGVAGAAFASLFNQAPSQQIYDDLFRFKQVLETGEVLRSDGSPDGAGTFRQHPGQPAADSVARDPLQGPEARQPQAPIGTGPIPANNFRSQEALR